MTRTSPRPMGRRLAFMTGVAVLMYLALLHWGDAARARALVLAFPPLLAVQVLALTLASWGLRWLKFELFLRRLGVRVPLAVSARIFVSGMSMAITPGKLGEVLKSFLLREEAGVPVARTASVILLERVTDVVGLLGLLMLASRSGRGPGWVEAVSVVGVLVLLGVLAYPGPLVARLQGAGGLRAGLAGALESGQELTGPGLVLLTVALSVPAWGLEALGLAWILEGLGAPVALATAVWGYAFATLAGAVSMLPGGLGAAEGSLALLLGGAGVDTSRAVAATLLLRLATLWFGVAAGLLALLAGGRSPGDLPVPDQEGAG